MAEAGDMVYDVCDSDDDVFGRRHHQGSSLSSMYSAAGDVDEDDAFDGTRMSLSRLSIESCFDADDDEEEEQPPGGGKVVKGRRGLNLDMDMLVTSSDSDKDQPGGGGGGCYSLPATPTRRRSSQFGGVNRKLVGAKEYASENEDHKGFAREGASSRKARRRRASAERLLGGDGGSGQGGGEGSELMVITRPKGGRRSLCMDLEEVKACRDLGFELEHQRMMEVPSSRVSFSGATFDTTSSGGNSPIANWRISSPGDDPRDVKARLKVWAQAVAIASTSRQGGICLLFDDH